MQRSFKTVIISEESYFTLNGGFAVIYLKDGKGDRIIKDCVDVSRAGLKLPYRFLNPLQTAFFYYWVPEKDKSVLCVAPTSAGKTGLIYTFFSAFTGKKLYLAPTKALCDEKFREFSSIFGKQNVSIRTGDKFDFLPPDTEYIVSTYESCLASARSGSSWFEDVEAICVDEVHFLMFGGSRGIFLEELIAHTRARGKSILALSATIPKSAAEEYSQWLSAKLFYSSWRPVPLERRIEPLSEIEKEIFGTRLKGDVSERIVNVALKICKSQKVLIFVYKKVLGWKILEEFDRQGYGVINESVPFEKRTRVPPDKAVVGFHNADIPYDERVEMERSFRDGNLRFLIATQTMAYGVNLPADEALIVVRHYISKTLPDTSTILQMEGRVGRFGISEKGISRIIPLSGENVLKRELEKFFNSPDTRTSLEKLLEGDSEKRISDVDAMTLLVLGIIVSNKIDITDRAWAEEEIRRILSFMKTSFSVEISHIITILEESGCIKGGKVTPLGRILASSLTPPSAYKEFLRRYKGVDSAKLMSQVAYIIRPLLFFRDFQKSFIDILPQRLKEEIELEISDIYEEESILNLWMTGRIWWYFRNPPAQFYLRPDALQLVKFLSSLKFLGYIRLSLRDIMKVGMSLSFGVHPEFSLLCGSEKIGFSRANAIYHTASQMGMSFKSCLEMLKSKDADFSQAIFRTMLKRAEFIDTSLRSEWAQYDPQKREERLKMIERINHEINIIFSAFDDVESEDDLFDEELARIMVFVKEGSVRAAEISRDELKKFLQEEEQYQKN